MSVEGAQSEDDYDLEAFVCNVKRRYPTLDVSGEGEIDYDFSITEYKIYTEDGEVHVEYDDGDDEEEFSD